MTERVFLLRDVFVMMLFLLLSGSMRCGWRCNDGGVMDPCVAVRSPLLHALLIVTARASHAQEVEGDRAVIRPLPRVHNRFPTTKLTSF